MSGEEEARYLEAIRANPDDDAARLAYAEFLDGRGDPRGELVRIEVELTRLKPRLAELRKTLAPEWLATIERRVALVLVRIDSEKKVQTVAAVRDATGLGLRESVELVSAAQAGRPQIIRSGLEAGEAEKLARSFSGIADVRIERPSPGHSSGRSENG